SMRYSFSNKFLDYVAVGKHVIHWRTEYGTAGRVARTHGGAVVVSNDDADAVLSVCREIANGPGLYEKLSKEATHLHQTLFNPDRLQGIFVGEIEKLAATRVN